MVNFLKRLFGGNKPVNIRDAQQRGYLLYVQPKACAEVLQVRVDLMNELSQSDDGAGYFVRKLVRGNRCPFTTEITLYFDLGRHLINHEVLHGALVDEAAYVAYTQAHKTP